MNDRIQQLRDFIMNKGHHYVRRTPESLGLTGLNADFEAQKMHPQLRSAKMLDTLLQAEVPVIFPGERIVATRTITRIPSIFTDNEWEEIKKRHTLHERGTVSNISPDYSEIISKGLEAKKAEVKALLETASDAASDYDANDPAQSPASPKMFYESVLSCIESVQDFIAKYEDKARELGETETADILSHIRTEGATTLREALQLLRFVHFALWESDCYHNTLGRFDQYMYPYFKSDIDSGRLTESEAFDLIEEFFLMCNKDSDLYIGMQQGDNGQSIVLAGRNQAGEYLFNEISRMAMKASYELNMIDPKINLRCDSKTPQEVFELGATLTERGLGFPQYDNDDVVIPGLIKLGYSPEDAYNYVVAACWEFIIPRSGMEIPNIDAMSFAGIVSSCTDKIAQYDDYDSFYGLVDRTIREECRKITCSHDNLYIAPAPFMSILMGGTLERGMDISLGGDSNNYGIHGTGIATAADSLAALKKYYFEEKSISAEQLSRALETDFSEDRELYDKLRFNAPKMGQDDDFVDNIAISLLDSFSSALEGIRNERGGIWRAGTGTAMYYVRHASDLKATADGRHKGEVIPANYSPSLFIRQNGPVSVIKSFAKPDLTKTINGGPLTIELDDTIFRNEETLTKLALLIKSYVSLGGHQLQLNTLNKEQLLDAKVHPELHRNLIVRVWGWSGYFVELDECYQNHVINRIKFNM